MTGLLAPVWTKPHLKLALGVALVVGLLLAGYRLGGGGVRLGSAGGTLTVSDADECLRRGGNIYFNITFGSEAYLRKIGEWETAQRRSRMAQAFVISANTHVGSIRDLSLEDRVFLIMDGKRYPSSGKPVASTTHHDTYIVFFPKYDMNGQPMFNKASGTFDIMITGVEVPERRLTFRFPLPGEGRQGLDVQRAAMLFGSALAALLVACTPCLVGSLAVGSLTMGTAAGAAEPSGLARLRAGMVRQTLYYLGGLVVTYLGVALLTIALKINTAFLRPAEVVGGLILLVIGLGFLRGWGPASALAGRFRRMVRRLGPVGPGSGTPGPGTKTQVEHEPASWGGGTSSAMGASLAMVCSVAGAPTLSTAIILPVMVYAGVNDFYGSLAVLAVYLVVSAIPFFLIAVGLGETLLMASLRWRQRLLIANGFLLVSLGLLLIFSQERVADALSVPVKGVMAPFIWLLGRITGSA